MTLISILARAGNKSIRGMDIMSTVFLLFALMFGLQDILEGAYFENAPSKIRKKEVIGRFQGVTKISCVHRCRGNMSCHQAAMQGSDCLFLRKGLESSNEGEEMVNAKVLSKVRKLVGKIMALHLLNLFSQTP